MPDIELPATNETPATTEIVAAPTEGIPATKVSRKPRKERRFPALSFEEALKVPLAIQDISAGQKVRRLLLFEKLDRNPDSVESRRLVTASGQYGLTRGGYAAEYLQLTPEGIEATDETVEATKKLQVRADLAILKHTPFDLLYQKVKGSKMPVKEVLADYLTEAHVEEGDKSECIDTFIVNAKFLGLLRTLAGTERIVSIEQAIEETPTARESLVDQPAELKNGKPIQAQPALREGAESVGDFDEVCFYITPIGDEASEGRRHADFMMEYIIKPAVEESGLKVIRADQMGKPGMIGKQVIEHILKARLVVADLSFHNPNVFYELCLRHATRLPTVQVKRTLDSLPFDLNQYTTISIETRDPYTLVPKIPTYVAEVANQVRQALRDSQSGDNPISLYYPSATLTWKEK
jgi:hypothetical protein